MTFGHCGESGAAAARAAAVPRPPSALCIAAGPSAILALIPATFCLSCSLAAKKKKTGGGGGGAAPTQQTVPPTVPVKQVGPASAMLGSSDRLVLDIDRCCSLSTAARPVVPCGTGVPSSNATAPLMLQLFPNGIFPEGEWQSYKDE